MLARTPDSFGPLDERLEPGVEEGQVSGNLIILIKKIINNEVWSLHSTKLFC